MASYAGFDLGIVELWIPSPHPNDRQINAYPGVNGLEVLELGSRGGESVYHVAYPALDIPSLSAFRAAFVGLQASGTTNTLVDPEFFSWDDAILEKFTPAGPRYRNADDSFICQRFELRFLHTGS